MQYDRDMVYLARHYDRQIERAREEREQEHEQRMNYRGNQRKNSSKRAQKKSSNPAEKFAEKLNQLPQEKLKSILRNSVKLKNQGVVVREAYGGEKIQNKMKELDRLVKECEIKEQQRIADKKKREEEIIEKNSRIMEETFAQKRDRKSSVYYVKLLDAHGSLNPDDILAAQLHANDGDSDEEATRNNADSETTSSAGISNSPSRHDRLSDEEEEDEAERGSNRRQRRRKTADLKRDENGFLLGERREDRIERRERRARKKEWNQAYNARYVRTAKPRNFEIELGVHQIFSSSRLERK